MCRNLCLSLVAKRGDARRVETGRLADLDLLLGEFERAAEKFDDMLCNGEALGRARGIGIGTRGIGDDRHANRVGVRLGCRDVAAAGLDAAADAAEQVDLVGDLKPGVEAGRCVGVAGIAAAGCAGADTALGEAVDLYLTERGTGAGEAGDRCPDIGVVSQRVGDQPVEHRVIVEPPPIVRHRRERLHRRRVGGDEWAGGGRCRRRLSVVRDRCCTPPGRAPRRCSKAASS